MRISTSFIEKSEERSAFLSPIISCSLIGLLIIAVLNFLRFSDRSFVSAFEPIFILKLDWTVKRYLQNTKGHHSNKFFLTIRSTVPLRVPEVSE